MSKPRVRRWFLGVAVGAAAFVAACASRVSDRAEQAPEREKFRGPVNVVIDTTLDRGELSPEQEAAVLAIRDRMEGERGNKRELKKQLRAAASEIVRAGTAESEELDAAVALATDALEKRMKLSGDALKEIHGLLDAEQRALVAEGLREHVEARAAAKRERERENGFRKIAAHLMLDAAQIEKLRRLRDEIVGEKKELRPSEEEIAALIDAFEGESFPEALDQLGEEKVGIMREKIATAAGRVDGVLSLLSDNQRDVLADLIERGPRAVGIEDEG